MSKKEERKTKRSGILFRPSTHEKLTKIAMVQDTSLNDILHQLADDYIEQHKDDLKRYEEIQKIMNK